MFLILTPCFGHERRSIRQIIRVSACVAVKTILSMESMYLLDCSQPLAMSRTLLFTVQVPDLMRQDG